MSNSKLPDGVPIVHDVERKKLNNLQIEDYRDHREKVLSWLWNEGKDPDTAEGYSESVVENTAYRLSKVYRWVWENEGYTSQLTHEHADTYIDELRAKDWTDDNKNQYVKALNRYFAWRTYEKGVDEWGDRVHIEADAARLADEDDRNPIFARGDRLLIDDHATVVDSDDGRIVVELDEQGVQADTDGFAAIRFEVKGENVVALWEVFDEDAIDEDAINGEMM